MQFTLHISGETLMDARDSLSRQALAPFSTFTVTRSMLSVLMLVLPPTQLSGRPAVQLSEVVLKNHPLMPLAR
jgi:hypothetical protein